MVIGAYDLENICIYFKKVIHSYSKIKIMQRELGKVLLPAQPTVWLGPKDPYLLTSN